MPRRALSPAPAPAAVCAADAGVPGSRHRVLMVSDFFYPNTGGVEVHMFQLSQCLLSRGHKARPRHAFTLLSACRPTQRASFRRQRNTRRPVPNARRPAQVVVLTRAHGPRGGVRFMTRGLKVYYAPRLPIFGGTTLPGVVGLAPLLRCILLRERITLVHGHGAFRLGLAWGAFMLGTAA